MTRQQPILNGFGIRPFMFAQLTQQEQADQIQGRVRIVQIAECRRRLPTVGTIPASQKRQPTPERGQGCQQTLLPGFRKSAGDQLAAVARFFLHNTRRRGPG